MYARPLMVFACETVGQDISVGMQGTPEVPDVDTFGEDGVGKGGAKQKLHPCSRSFDKFLDRTTVTLPFHPG